MDGEEDAVALSHAELDLRARALGSLLQEEGAAGERVLLLYPPGLEYVAAFFGCLYAGAIAVPAYPPRLRSLDRVRSIVGDARPLVALIPDVLLGRVEGWCKEAPELRAIRWRTGDGVDEARARIWRDPGVSAESLAFLQYTSGSTGNPKGVMVRHGDLIDNSARIARSFGLRPESRVCSWLPPFHDMGLIGGILQPLYAGVPAILMSPVAFLQQPVRWLRAISRSGATISGGPNFAYDLCAERIAPEERRHLDLSSWEIAFNGAEPVRAATQELFVAAFAECGLRSDVFFPCYGLAEATLMVACGRTRVREVSSLGLESHRVLPAAAGTESRTLVASGLEGSGLEIAVVDPASRMPVAEGGIGEIWVTGPSVAGGYWNRPEETRETFEARLATPAGAGGDRTWLRTGDLGFLADGSLFVAGRLKDLILIRGSNHYPQDIEQTVEASHPALRPGGCVAFSIEAAGEELLVVVQEVERQARHRSAAEVWDQAVTAIRDAVVAAHGLAVHAVVLVPPGEVPKTSSGKVQRQACRKRFLEGTLATLTGSLPAAGEESAPAAARSAEPTGDLEARLRRAAARVLKIEPERLDPARPLADYGLDSLRAMELGNAVEAELGLTLALEELLVSPSLAELAERIAARWTDQAPERGLPPLERRPAGMPVPLAEAQRRIWFLAQMEPGDPAYHIAAAVELEGPLATSALARALEEVVRRHEALRLTLPAGEGEPVQEVGPPFAPALPRIDLAALPRAARERAAERAAADLGRQPFDLARGPLLRATLLGWSAREHRLVAVLHHAVADGGSLGLLLAEIASLYGAFAAGRPSPLPAPGLQYPDFACWQQRVQAEAAARDLDWWRERLAGAPLVLALPYDRPRPERAGGRPGARLPVRLPAARAEAIGELARRSGTTPFVLLLALFGELLHRSTGQEDLCLGSPVANRGHRTTEEMIGCFVNTLVLRADLSGDPTFGELLPRVRATVLGALAHRTLSFERLVAALGAGSEPGGQPLVQAMFAFQTFPLETAEAAGLRFAPRELDLGTAQLDLSLALTPREGDWDGYLEYGADRFDPTTALRLLAHFSTLLEGALAEPERRLSALLLLAPAERHQLLREWQGGSVGGLLGEERLVHEEVAARARLTPGAPALVGGEDRLSYRDLDSRARCIARALREAGAGPEVVVGLCLGRSVDLPVAMLAVLATGAAYLPLDPGHPAERLAEMLREAGAPLVLAREGVSEVLLARITGTVRVLLLDRLAKGEEPAAGSLGGPLAENPAYLLYTSGSTGRPKGVLVPHGALARHAAAVVRELGLTAADRVLQFAAPGFDVAAEEIFPTWLAGGTVVVAPDAVRESPAALAPFLDAEAISVLNLPTPYWQEWLSLPQAGAALAPPLRLVVVGSDTVLPAALASWRRLAGKRCDWRNGYGVTEATITSTFARLPAAGEERERVPIGRPLDQVETYILDGRGCPAPLGAPGELYLGGGALARGYLGRPDLTAERFLPHPAAPAGKAGERLYRTGDLARWRPDGELELLGRADRQVKVRGIRLEPGEVEAALLFHEAVGEAAVVVREVAPGERRLVAWLVPAHGETLAPAMLDDLRAHLRRRLPEPLVPAAFAELPALPRLASGKVDRRHLETLSALAAMPSRPAGAAPGTPVEETLAAIWSELLGADRIGREESFFDLGGHSLLAARAMARVQQVLGVELGVRELFAAPTVAALARRVEEAWRGGAPAAIPLRPARHTGPPPLSPAQERLWFLDRLEPGSALYNVPAVVQLAGQLSLPALAAALSQVVARQEALRTRFPQEGGRPVQRIEPAASMPSIPLSVVDLAGLPAPARRREAGELAAAEARRPFDLARGPLLRPALLRLAAEEHELLLTLHHIVCDGWSLSVLLREMGNLYAAAAEGSLAGLPELPVQYGDWALWQREQLQGPRLAGLLAYWRERLAGAPPLLELPSDRPRPPVQSERGGVVPVLLPAPLAAGLAAFGRERGATLFMVVLAGFQALLHRCSRQAEICVGTPVANRGAVEVEDLIGFFANLLVLRTDLSGSPDFGAVVERVRDVALGAFAHQDLPFERLVEELRPRRDFAHTPLFQAMLAWQDAPLPPLALPGLTLTAAGSASGTAKYDLTLSLEEVPQGLAGTLEYRRDLFDGTTAARLALHLARLLEAAVSPHAAPGMPLAELPLASTAERWQMLGEWNDTAAPAPEGCIHQRFAAQVERTPGEVALVCGTEELTYRELEAQANRLARHLLRRGAGPEALVGVRLERTAELVVALLAVLKTGAAYVPLDPAYPEERQAWILADARARWLLTREEAPAGLREETGVIRLDREAAEIEAQPGSPLSQPVPLDALAYVIYTSGSTGRPKGVAIAHRAAAALLDWAAPVFPAADLAGVLAATSICFDLSVFELFLPLSRGGRVLLAEHALALPTLPAAGRVTLVNTVPSVLAELIESSGLPPAVRVVNLAGEPLGRPLVDRLYRLPGVERVFNLYGPSEDTTYSTWELVPPEERGAPAIGRPIAGTEAWLLDSAGLPVPLGVPGELFLSGRGLARGYLGRPDLTAERFVPHPSGGRGERAYRTGDLARHRADGRLEFLGRVDHQVKVRGFRIEPGEIESALAAHPAVWECAVVAQRYAAGDLRLVAYLVPSSGGDAAFPVAELRSHLRQSLPEHMIPAAFVALPELPRMPNGKVDRRAFAARPAVSPAGPAGGEGPVAPRTPVEEILLGLWRDLLAGEAAAPLGVEDDFFALGGHSLLATRLMARIGEVFGVEIPVRTLFEAPTPAALAARIAAAGEGGAPGLPPVRRRAARLEDTAPPLSFAQERFWFLDRLEPGSAHYNLPAALRIAGPLKPAVLAGALAAAVERHEGLRTTFAAGEDGPVQAIAPHATVALPQVDLSALPAALRGGEAELLATAEVRRPFDLARGPLLRNLLLRLEEEEHLLVATVHHAVADGWSLGILVAELSVLYGAGAAGRPSPLPPLPVQAADFALWQRQRAADGGLDGDLAYWRGRLAALPPALELPADRPRPAVESHRGGRVPVRIPQAVAEGAGALGRSRGATPFMALLAAFAALLHQASGERDFAVGSPVANRPRPEVEGVIGPLVNTLVLRLDPAGDQGFGEWLERVRQTALDAYAHQDLPFERLVQEINPERRLGRQPLFQVFFAWQSFRLAPAAPCPGLAFLPREIESGMAHFDLSLFLEPREEGIAGVLEYEADLFDPATAFRLAGSFERLLAAAVVAPAEPLAALPGLSLGERRQVERRESPLPSVPAGPAAGARRHTPPRTPLEELLAGLWAEVLGEREPGVEDDFFALGGHSLLAARLLTRLRRLVSVDLPLRALFETPTIAGLAARIEAAWRAPGGDAAAPEPIPLVPRDGHLPLSFPQRRLWFLDQLEPGSAAYNIPVALRLQGELRPEALAGALAAIVARHEALRTTFAEADGANDADTEPVQVIAGAGSARVEVPLIDLAGLPGPAGEREAGRLTAEETRRPFDLARGPLLRLCLLRTTAARDHLALLTLHHTVADGWSLGVLVEELGALYTAAVERRAAPLAPLPIQYADWAAWQRARLSGGLLESGLADWRRRLAGAPPALTLPFDRPRPAWQSSRGATLDTAISADLLARLRAASRAAGATLFMTLLAAFQELLGRHAGQEDVTVGTPVAQRNRLEIEGLIGCFVNTLPLRLDLSGDPALAELVARARRAALEAFALQDVPFELLVEALAPGRERSYAPLFQALLVLQNTPLPDLALPGLALSAWNVDTGTAKLDLTLTLVEGREGCLASFEYNRDLFDRATVARIAERWQILLASFADAPALRLSEAPLLPAAERWQILGEWNEQGRAPALAASTLHGLFAVQAERAPEATAVIDGEERWSYRRLAERALRIAAHLAGLGIGPESLVGICMERSPEMVAALLGVLEAGGAYLPIDPAYPAERRRFQLADAGAAVVLTTSALRAAVAEDGARPVCLDLLDAAGPGPASVPAMPAAGAGNLAYVIYTSGSTGRPKGVAIEHRSAVALLAWAIARFTPADLGGVLASTSICFDLSVFELFAPLACGGTVILAADALALPGLPARGEVRLVNTVPSAAAEWLRAGGLPDSVRTVNLAGEPLPRELVERLYEETGVERVVNLYGPTEDTTYSTCAVLPRGARVSPDIGWPLPGSRAHVLDPWFRLAPVGVPGELYLGGEGLARGYLGRPDLTAERFVPDPFADLAGEPGARLYRTGDLVRRRPGGELDFLGRIDHQIKLRGFRIELGEIEAVLRQHPGVGEAVVLAREDRPGDRRLAAYVGGESVPPADALRAFAADRLPAYMVPAAFVALPALPRTPNGKVDRGALPAPDFTSRAGETGGRPRGAVAEVLAEIWCDVLGIDRVGPEDDFFALGGHSLLATQLVSRVRQAFRVDLPLRLVFAAPTFAGLAAALAEARTGPAASAALGPIPRCPGGGPGEGKPRRLSHAQQRLWLLDRMRPGSAFYNLPMAVGARGRVDLPVLQASFQEIARRHEVLRTTFAFEEGEPRQVIRPAAPVRLPLVDLRGLPAPRREDEMRRLADEEARHPFDLQEGPLWRATLLQTGAGEHALLLTLHHIVFDDWSMGVFLRELAALYEAFAAGRPSPLPEPALQYADFAHWQRRWLADGALAAQLDYWRRHLAGLPELRLPLDRPRTRSTGSRGRHLAFSIPADLVAELRALSRRRGATLFMTLLAGFAALLHRYSGQEDIALGSPIANRNRAEIEGLIGFFVNELVLRLDLRGNPSFSELLGRVREVVLDAFAHQDASFDEVVAAVGPGRRRGQTPLVQVQFDLHNAPVAALPLPGLMLEPLAVERGEVQFDLQMSLTETEGELAGMLGYNVALFHEATVERLLRHYTAVLREAARDPELRLLELQLEERASEVHAVSRAALDAAESFNF